MDPVRLEKGFQGGSARKTGGLPAAKCPHLLASRRVPETPHCWGKESVSARALDQPAAATCPLHRPLLDEGYDLAVGLPDDAPAVHLHKPIT